MHRILSTPSRHLPGLPRHASTPTLVSLNGILRERGQMYLAVGDGTSNWMVSAKPADLSTVDRFCRAVANQIGQPVTHPSQARPLHHQRQLGWIEAIRSAYRRGVGR